MERFKYCNKKFSVHLSFPPYFNIGNTERHNMINVVNSMNNFFVNVGPYLIKQTPDPLSEEQADN